MPLSFLIFFGILFVLVCFLRAARIGALVAFLAAGVLSGPFGLNLFEMNQTWQLLGIRAFYILLLFGFLPFL